MVEKVYIEDLKQRFKKTRKALDKTIEDYMVKKFKEDSDDAYDYLSSLFNEKNRSEETESAEKQHEDDTVNSSFDETISSNIKLKKNFLGEINGTRFDRLVLELGRYTRKTTQKLENFTYFEVYDKYGITAILVKPDMMKEVLLQELNLSNSDYKIVIEQIKIGSYFIKPFRKEKLYRQDWIEDYQISVNNTFKNSDADAIMSCPDPKLVYTIAGYAILAYMMQVFNRFNSKVLALNIVTDKESVEIIQNLIQNCFVNSGYNDNIGIITFEAKAKAEIYYPNCEGRCVVVDAMTKESKDALNPMLSKYFSYIRETTRKVEYPYLFFPIILSNKPIGNEFYTIEAKELSKKQEQWKPVYNALHCFYKNPIDLKSVRYYNEATKEICYAENILSVFNSIYDVNRNSFFIPFSNYPVYKHGMDVLLNSCCNLASLNIDFPVEPFSLFSAKKSSELRMSVYQYLPVSNLNDKYNDNINMSLKPEISPICQIIDKISEDIKKDNKKEPAKKKFYKPLEYKENVDIGFLFKNINFDEQCFCFNQNFIASLLSELELEEKYNVDSFIDDCVFAGLLVRDKSEGRKKIKVRFDNGTNRLYALKAHDKTGLLYTSDEIQSIISDLEKDEAPELPTT